MTRITSLEVLLIAVVLGASSESECEVIPGFSNRVATLNWTPRLDGLITLYLTVRLDRYPGPLSDRITFLGRDGNTILQLEANLMDGYYGREFVVLPALRRANAPEEKYATDYRKKHTVFSVSHNNEDVALQIRVNDDGTYDLYLLKSTEAVPVNLKWEGFVSQPIWDTTQVRHMSYEDGAAPVDVLINKITVCKDSRPSVQNVERMEVKPGEEVLLSCNGTGPSRLIVDWVDQNGTYLNGQTEFLDALDGVDLVKSVLKVTVPEETESERTGNSYEYKCTVRNIVDGKGIGEMKTFIVEPKQEEEQSKSSSYNSDDLKSNQDGSWLKHTLLGALLGFVLACVAFGILLTFLPHLLRRDWVMSNWLRLTVQHLGRTGQDDTLLDLEYQPQDETSHLNSKSQPQDEIPLPNIEYCPPEEIPLLNPQSQPQEETPLLNPEFQPRDDPKEAEILTHNHAYTSGVVRRRQVKINKKVPSNPVTKKERKKLKKAIELHGELVLHGENNGI